MSLPDIGIDFDVEETGSTFQQNAVLKADAYGSASGLLTLAEDAWLAADFPLDQGALKTIADQAVARFTRDNRL